MAAARASTPPGPTARCGPTAGRTRRPVMAPRRAAVSSFGFGGSNYHVTLEEYRGPGRTAPRLRVAPTEVVILAAENPLALAARCRKLAAEVRPGSLPFLAHRTQREWRPDQP